MARHGGQPYVLHGVQFEGECTTYRGFRVRRDTTLLVRTPSGRVERIAVMGSVLERQGRWKVFSYVVD